MAKVGAGSRAGSWWRPALFALVLVLASAACLAGRAGPASAICQDPPCIDPPPPPPPINLRVTIQGRGSVTDPGVGVSCASSPTAKNTDESSACDTAIADGTSVSLTAHDSGEYAFAHWSGDICDQSTASACTFDMNQPYAVTAVFADHTGPGTPVIGMLGTGDVVRSDDPVQALAFTGGLGALSHSCMVIGDGSAVVDTSPCEPSGWSPGALPTHKALTLSVTGYDENHNPSVNGTRDFKYVNIADTGLLAGPAAHSSTSSKHTNFAYTTTIPGASFRCDLTRDGTAVSNSGCVPDLGGPAGLADGAYALRVFAGVQIPGADGTTYEDRDPATRSWRVDTSPPQTTISSGPNDGLTTNASSATFAFSGDDATPAGYAKTLRYECKLDSGAFTACTSAHALGHLGFASHTFEVRAIDAAGNADPTPARRTWKVIADLDGDGANVPGDCNDNDPSIRPGLPEIDDNSVDENCDGIRGVNLDRDGDGVQVGTDCDDTNPAIKPGAYDKPGDSIDQDCSGKPADYQRPGTTLSSSWSIVGRRTVFPVFRISGAPAGAKVTVSCTGKGCTFKGRKLKLKSGKADMHKLVKRGIPVGKGATIDVRTTVTDMLVSIIRSKVGKNGKVKTAKLCIRPGSKKTFTCG